jgi:hypothetical protein
MKPNKRSPSTLHLMAQVLTNSALAPVAAAGGPGSGRAGGRGPGRNPSRMTKIESDQKVEKGTQTGSNDGSAKEVNFKTKPLENPVSVGTQTPDRFPDYPADPANFLGPGNKDILNHWELTLRRRITRRRSGLPPRSGAALLVFDVTFSISAIPEIGDITIESVRDLAV